MFWDSFYPNQFSVDFFYPILWIPRLNWEFVTMETVNMPFMVKIPWWCSAELFHWWQLCGTLFYGTGPPPPPRSAQQRAHSLRQPIPPAGPRRFSRREKTGIDISQTNQNHHPYLLAEPHWKQFLKAHFAQVWHIYFKFTVTISLLKILLGLCQYIWNVTAKHMTWCYKVCL